MRKIRPNSIRLNRWWLPALLFIVYAPGIVAQKATYTNSIGMEFVLIQPGSMVVGRFQPPYPKRNLSKNVSAATNKGMSWTSTDYQLAVKLGMQEARPGFSVTISRPYYIGKFEVTQEQWKQVMGNNPSVFQGDKVKDDANQHPVESVTWQDAQKFLSKLNALEKGRHYRLPTEFEWEYAARAGATDDIAWKDIQAAAQLGSVTTGRVGQKAPNAWGVYDTLGNVWEWVQDYYNEKLFANPLPPRTGKQHVLKGASFMGDVKNATYMTHAGGPGNGWDVGFRVVLETKR
jgi:sulfatase modifying factor 1